MSAEPPESDSTMIGVPPADAETPTMVGGVSRASVESYLQATRLAQDRIAEVTSAIAALKAENETFRVKVDARLGRQFEERRERLLLSSVQTLEGLDDAIQSAREGGAAEGLIQGVLLVRSQLFRLLQEEGLQRISVLGLAFDAETSDVVRTVPVDEEGQDGLVVEEIRSGQQLRGRVVRKARVVIGEYMTIVDEDIPMPTMAMPAYDEPAAASVPAVMDDSIPAIAPAEDQEPVPEPEPEPPRPDEEEVAEPTQAMPVMADSLPQVGDDRTVDIPPWQKAPELTEEEEPEPEEEQEQTIVRPPPFDEREAADSAATEEEEREEEEEASTVVQPYPMAQAPTEDAEESAEPAAVAEPEPEPAERFDPGATLPPAERAAYVPAPASPEPVAAPAPAPIPEAPAARVEAPPAPRVPERPRAPEPPPPAAPTPMARAPRPAPPSPAVSAEVRAARPSGKGSRLAIIGGIVLLGVLAFVLTLRVSRPGSRQAATSPTATVAPAGPGAAPAGDSGPGPAPVEESITVVVPTIPTDVVIVPPAPSTIAPVPTLPMRTMPTPPPTTAPNPAPALVAQADRAIAAAHYDDALRLYEQALQADPRSAEATAGRARATTLRDLSRRTFAGTPTSVQTESTGKGPAGFDTSDVKVTKPAKNSGKIDFEVTPKMPLPGQPYTVAIYLTNTGSKGFKVEEVRAGATVNGQGAPKPQTAKLKEVAPSQRTLVAEVSDQWKDGTLSWSFSATVTAPGGEKFTSKLTWK